MESLYFFSTIIVLVIAGQYLVHRINKESYLHVPARIPSLKRSQQEPVAARDVEKPLTRSQKNLQNYVDWYTTRNTAVHGGKVFEDEPDPQPEPKVEDQEVFVGMAVFHETKDAAETNRPERNIDRWYRAAVGA